MTDLALQASASLEVKLIESSSRPQANKKRQLPHLSPLVQTIYHGPRLQVHEDTLIGRIFQGLTGHPLITGLRFILWIVQL